MMTGSFSLLRALRLLIAACCVGALATVPAAAQSAKPPAPAPDAVVRALYQHYLDTRPDTAVAFDYTDPSVAKDYFDPALAKLLVADGKRDEARLDFDPFVDGQDFEITSVDYATKTVSSKEAQVSAQFQNFDEKKTVTYKVVRTPAGWRIADVLWGGSRDTLRKLLSAPDR
ncbi:DUF3828 domain-containing protein [Aquabacter sp. CN5-332]